MKRIQGVTKEFIEVNDELEENYIIKNYPQFKKHGEDKMTKKKYYFRDKDDSEINAD